MSSSLWIFEGAISGRYSGELYQALSAGHVREFDDDYVLRAFHLPPSAFCGCRPWSDTPPCLAIIARPLILYASNLAGVGDDVLDNEVGLPCDYLRGQRGLSISDSNSQITTALSVVFSGEVFRRHAMSSRDCERTLHDQ